MLEIELSMKSVKIWSHCIWHYVYIITACSFINYLYGWDDFPLRFDAGTLKPTLISSMLKPNYIPIISTYFYYLYWWDDFPLGFDADPKGEGIV